MPVTGSREDWECALQAARAWLSQKLVSPKIQALAPWRRNEAAAATTATTHLCIWACF